MDDQTRRRRSASGHRRAGSWRRVRSREPGAQGLAGPLKQQPAGGHRLLASSAFDSLSLAGWALNRRLCQARSGSAGTMTAAGLAFATDTSVLFLGFPRACASGATPRGLLARCVEAGAGAGRCFRGGT